MAKAIYFDMDGTIAELYKVENWLSMLREENVAPYQIAAPKVDMAELATILFNLKGQGYTIGIISWLSKESSDEYKKATREAKRMWLKQNVPFIFDEMHLVQYGEPKHYIPRVKRGILVDDNAKVREDWENHGGTTINADPADWLTQLRSLI